MESRPRKFWAPPLPRESQLNPLYDNEPRDGREQPLAPVPPPPGSPTQALASARLCLQ